MLSWEDRFALEELVNRYSYHLDLWQVNMWVELFAEQGTLDESALGMGVYIGHQAIAAYGSELQADVLHVVHLMMNHVILESDTTQASGCVFALVEAMTRSSGHTRYYIRYEDAYIKTPSGWRFGKRTILPMFPPQIVSPA
ncbi:nuclear transport factor 2 family protein [Rhizorhapis suberifaciens]|uniref:SnoaL-like domain-containing protein n=1 Tax=Rhizorhapis suberifaciens TaxID=13656 RepID=A0A840I032_9SPHN|nr:nuclear transport factor 2 family protein [Rhizorhapis suberifaciens]MBB4643016.1 hypothetical protein [Rhizorhapis suberifaciens]